MALSRRAKKNPEPWTEVDDLAAQAAFPKGRYRKPPEESIDTTALLHRKVHPNRDEAYKRWLNFRPCAIKGLTDNKTGLPHVCWSPTMRGREFVSDAAHGPRAGLGLKGDDSGCLALCRHAHRDVGDRMDDLESRYGVDWRGIAAELYARFRAEQERRQ